MKCLITTALVILATLSLNAFQSGDITAFVYHRFGDDRYPSTNIDLDKFEAHLKYLSENNYQVVTMSAALALAQEKEKNRPDQMVVITIDDAYTSFYENALPLLKKYGFKATLYANTGTIAYDDYMDWQQLRDAAAYGIEIGNHSHDHHYFLNEPIDLFESDLALSDSLFAYYLSAKPVTYAYPYGEWQNEMHPILKKYGYTSAAAQNSGVIGNASHLFYLPRFPMSNAYAGIDKFKEKLQMRSLSALDVEIIDHGYMGSVEKPRAIFKFRGGDISVASVQAFIASEVARKSAQVVRDGVLKLTVWPYESLERRRILFTVTGKDNKGMWHWFSYLYVNPKIPE